MKRRGFFKLIGAAVVTSAIGTQPSKAMSVEKVLPLAEELLNKEDKKHKMYIDTRNIDSSASIYIVEEFSKIARYHGKVKHYDRLTGYDDVMRVVIHHPGYQPYYFVGCGYISPTMVKDEYYK